MANIYVNRDKAVMLVPLSINIWIDRSKEYKDIIGLYHSSGEIWLRLQGGLAYTRGL